jgi:hypothetical protein
MKISLFSFAALCVLALFSCSEPKEINMGQIHQLEDSIAKAVPTVSTIHTFVKGRSTLIVILGDVSFYKSGEAKKQEKAIEVGAMALRIFGPENGITKGQFIITKVLDNTQEIPADGIKTDMRIDSLQKAIYNK